MAIQIPNLGTAPSGTGGDTSRSAMSKIINNFSTTTHAANRLVGTASGNVMEVGAFGVGNKLATLTANIDLNTSNLATGFYSGRNWANAPIANNADSWGYLIQQNLASVGAGGYELQIVGDVAGLLWVRSKIGGTAQSWSKIWTSKNTTVDSNGFIKAASPIIKLFADKIEANDEALEQNPVFEKVDVGHYLIKDTEGFSDNGWYIEMPKDANGNVLVAVQYQQLEGNTIEVKTFAKKFDEETGDIVPNLEKTRDIPAGRWIDIRLKELPEPEIKISNTPPDFQPTNLSQAISEMMNGSQQ